MEKHSKTGAKTNTSTGSRLNKWFEQFYQTI